MEFRSACAQYSDKRVGVGGKEESCFLSGMCGITYLGFFFRLRRSNSGSRCVACGRAADEVQAGG